MKNCFRTCLRDVFEHYVKIVFWKLRLFWTLRALHQSKPLILGRAAAGRAQAPANRLHSYWGLEYLLSFALSIFWVSFFFILILSNFLQTYTQKNIGCISRCIFVFVYFCIWIYQNIFKLPETYVKHQNICCFLPTLVLDGSEFVIDLYFRLSNANFGASE